MEIPQARQYPASWRFVVVASLPGSSTLRLQIDCTWPSSVAVLLLLLLSLPCPPPLLPLQQPRRGARLARTYLCQGRLATFRALCSCPSKFPSRFVLRPKRCRRSVRALATFRATWPID